MADKSGVPLLDVGRGNQPLREEIAQAFMDVFDSGRFLHGPQVRQLEELVAKHCGAEHAVGCASGSDALLLCLMAMGIGPGDEVITPSFTFFATVSAIVRVGATPVFADIEPNSFNMDPQAAASLVTERTRAMIPVHLFGQSADMAPLMEVAETHQLRVIEDAAQALGAEYDGRRIGSIGDAGCISFYPTKNLGGLGDGGMIVTNNEELADQLRLYSAHGMRPRYEHKVLGVNSRLDTLQAAALCVKMKHLDAWTDARRANAARYAKMFAERGLANITLPCETVAGKHVWNQYTIRVGGGMRGALREFLAERSIGAEIYYPIPVHEQECFRETQKRGGTMVETNRASEEVLSLPVFPELTEAEQQRVVETIAEFIMNQAAHAA